MTVNIDVKNAAGIEPLAAEVEHTLTSGELDEIMNRACGVYVQNMGDDFLNGNGVLASNALALYCYERAAKLGDLDGLNNMGSMFLNGLGTDADPKFALECYQAAAEEGHAIAQYNCGKSYLHGRGMAEDYKLAAYWLELAALQGDIEAICEFGTLHRFGHGVERDLLRAAELHLEAAAKGDATAHGNLCDYSDELFEMAVAGSATAALFLSKMFFSGLGVGKNMELAWAWVHWAHDVLLNQKPSEEEIEDHYRLVLKESSTLDRERGDICAGDWLTAFEIKSNEQDQGGAH